MMYEKFDVPLPVNPKPRQESWLFCWVCGSALFFAAPRWAGETHVAVATLLGALGQKPTVHAYADRAPDWCPITDELSRYGGESGTEKL